MNEPTDNSSGAHTAFVPDLIYTGGKFQTGVALICDDVSGRVASLTPAAALDAAERFNGRVVRLAGRALLPGLVNAHSHAFQRVIRGRTEYRSAAHAHDSFWTWREMMYEAAARLSPEDLYDASRMAFMEMALSGITAVGEFHYLHRTTGGASYADPNLLAKQVVRAARDTGLRIALLRVAYARAGHRLEPDPRQRRFIEPEPETYLRHLEDLRKHLAGEEASRVVSDAWTGLAPHSVRAVPLDYLRELAAYASAAGLPFHMHVAEQPAELAACREEYGRTPVRLLADEGLLNPLFTAVHAVHVTREEARALGTAGACVCVCPTTERNLGDGIVAADILFEEGVGLALGTDSQTQIDLMEDARELEYHLRLLRLRRAVLSPPAGRAPDDSPPRIRGEAEGISALAARLFDCVTVGGARSIHAPGGTIEEGRPADFFTVDLSDSSIAGAGAEDLLAALVFSLSPRAVRDVVAGGRFIVEGGRHPSQPEITERFGALQRKLWR